MGLQGCNIMLNQKTIVFKQWMYGSGSTAVASPRKPPALVADIRRQYYFNQKVNFL